MLVLFVSCGEASQMMTHGQLLTLARILQDRLLNLFQMTQLANTLSDGIWANIPSILGSANQELRM